jgi:hypothetical protein
VEGAKGSECRQEVMGGEGRKGRMEGRGGRERKEHANSTVRSGPCPSFQSGISKRVKTSNSMLHNERPSQYCSPRL